MKQVEINVRGLNQFYGKKQVLHNVDLQINQGMFGLLGRNGAGKTTFMKTLVTLIPVTQGEVIIDGVSIHDPRKIRGIIGYLPQDFTMYASMTIKESMEYLALLSDLPPKVIKDRVKTLLDQVNLTDHQRKKVKALSGGMKRRLGIAQALLHDPKVLIVDEPTAGLDPEERIRFRNLLSELAENRVVILSTHIVGDIEATCEHIAIMNEGHLVYNGTVANLLHSAEGKVYSVLVSKDELPMWKQRYVMTGMLMQGNQCQVRFVSETVPSDEARLVEPNIEDAYLLYIHRHQHAASRGEFV